MIAVIVGGLSLLRAFGVGVNATDFDCAEIAEQAQDASEDQTVKILDITNVVEVSVTEREGAGERRCTGQARWSDNTTSTVYLRAFDDAEGQAKVSYSNQGYN